jgi:hypothetical protein
MEGLMAKQNPEPTVVLFGNPNPQMQVRRPVVQDGEVVGHEQVSVDAPHLNQSVTRVEMRDGWNDPDHVELTLSTDNDRMLAMIARALGPDNREYAVGVYECEQVMAVHAAGAAPSWVACDDDGFAAALAKHFGCPVGEPTNLLTNGGRDALHAQNLSTSAPPATFNYIALTANSTAPAAGDTTLTAEIATAGGGLIRAQATYAHTAGTNTSTLTKTFTANGSDSLPVTIAKIGVFNASTSGTMGYETLLSSTATLSASGDNLTVTETVTAG